jgi:hypothetical protein
MKSYSLTKSPPFWRHLEQESFVAITMLSLKKRWVNCSFGSAGKWENEKSEIPQHGCMQMAWDCLGIISVGNI